MEPRYFEAVRAFVALFYSGIFWMMVLFLVENRRARQADRRPLAPLALLLMVGSIYLMLGVIGHQDVEATSLAPATHGERVGR